MLGVSPLCVSPADDSISAASASDVQDRLSSLELRVQQQEDELTVMKAALADVLRRLAQSEDTAAKKQQSGKGQTPLREAFSMSCITNGSSGGRKSHRDSSAVSHRDSSTVSVARKETLSSAAKSGGEKKKDKPPMQGIKEKEEPLPPQADDKPPSTPSTPQAPSPSSPSPSPHPLQPPRPTPESKGPSQAKRFLTAPTSRSSGALRCFRKHFSLKGAGTTCLPVRRHRACSQRVYARRPDLTASYSLSSIPVNAQLYTEIILRLKGAKLNDKGLRLTNEQGRRVCTLGGRRNGIATNNRKSKKTRAEIGGESTPSPDTPPPLKASRERCPPSAPRTSPLSPQPLSSVCPARRGASGRRGGGMERSQSSTWESSEESRNKLVKAASTSKLLAKVVKNAEKFVTHARRLTASREPDRVRALTPVNHPAFFLLFLSLTQAQGSSNQPRLTGQKQTAEKRNMTSAKTLALVQSRPVRFAPPLLLHLPSPPLLTMPLAPLSCSCRLRFGPPGFQFGSKACDFLTSLMRRLLLHAHARSALTSHLRSLHRGRLHQNVHARTTHHHVHPVGRRELRRRPDRAAPGEAQTGVGVSFLETPPPAPLYGYRGRDCRANVCLLPTGEIVYFIASVVVLFNFDERTQRHYLGHTDCVKCLAVHPDKIRIATGQLAGVDKDGRVTRMFLYTCTFTQGRCILPVSIQCGTVHALFLEPLQPHVRVWDSVTLTTLQVIGLGTFERGVGSLAFSKADSGTHLSVIDDSNEHMLTVWDWQKKSKIAEIKTTNEVVLAVEFHPTDANTIVTCGKSHIFFWTWSGNSLARKQGIFGKYEKPKFVQCLAFLNNGDILTGDSGGILLIWARSTVEPAPGKGPKGAFQILRQIKAHDGSVFTLCQMRNGTLLTGGGKDHKIILWDHDLNPERDIEVPDQYGTIRAVAEGKGEQFLVGTSRNFILRGTFNDGFQVEVQGHTDELWGLATHPFKELFLTCAQDRQVCLWNAVDHSLEWSRLLDEHGHCADFHPSGAVVAIGTHSGKWYALDAETRDLVAIHTDGNEQLSVMRYTVDGTLLAVGSHDNFIYLYTVSDKGRKYSRYGKCTGHSSYITHLDWSPDNKFIMSNSGDYEILYWDIPNGCKLIRNRSECKDIDWASYTCVLGFHVFGVWPEGSDGTDINALVRSHNRKVIALADDFCKVHLFQYPCSRPKAPSHKYSAHSSHVTNVSFLHSDSHLVSTGGKDTSIMQWRLVEKMPALVPSDTALGLTDSLPHNSSLRGAPFAPAMPQTTTTPVAVPSSLPIGGTQPDTNTPPPTPTESLEPTPNGQQEGLPETPPPLDEVTPPSDSTVSPKDSLEPSDDTATPSDEGTPFSPPS
ncbi:hypothetical protein P4O66_013500 [Electrophorus voltai]|uniref:HELP domain-containing protein n=1 Tax=Electrophorus voltai TaxID=2609070 RepID=A0AAD8Z2W2_9TELE|nr:hypothetical protein P4O66_013500 [Electrophorus voltai]